MQCNAPSQFSFLFILCAQNQDQVATDESQTNKSRKRSYSVGEDNLTWDVDNPYDPLKPNEYMKILEDRKNRRRKRALAKDNERYIKEQDRERDEIARERADATTRSGSQHCGSASDRARAKQTQSWKG